MFASTKTGFAPLLIIAEIVGIAVFATVMTSSPFFIPIDINAIKIASVPLPTAQPYFDLFFFKKFFSKLIKFFPKKLLLNLMFCLQVL